MKPSQLLVLLSVCAGGLAQSNTPANPNPPASSEVKQPAPATSAVVEVPAVSSAAKPPPSDNNPSVVVQPSASAARPNTQETPPAVSQPADKPASQPASQPPKNAPASSAKPAGGPDAATENRKNPATAAPPPPAPSSDNDPKVNSPGTSNPNRANSDKPQGSQALTGSIQVVTGTDGRVVVPAATETAARSGAPPPPAGNGTDTRSRASAAGTAADIATATPSSPALATTIAFAAAPSDAFASVNKTAVEKIPESKEPPPPDVPSINQFRAELNANIPEKALTEKNAKSLAILETAYFEYFVNQDPAPVDEGKLSISTSISSCEAKFARRMVKKRSLVDQVLGWVPLVSRDLRGFGNCKAVNSLEVGVYFHYMRATATAERPNELEARVKAQVDALNEALSGIRINFRYMGLNWWEPKANEDWTTIARRDTKLQEWQTRTRAPGKLTLTVWVVNGLEGNNKEDLNSYATFPNEELDAHDGIVIEAAHVQGGESTTLIHDVGHWFGLGHTFGKVGDQCNFQDGLTNGTQTSGNENVIYECSQVPCTGGAAIEINNYMSYSKCRGKVPRDGFTTDQKARIFANALQFRRGYETGECMPDGKAAVRKRSSMQDLLDGKCPDYEKQASILVNTPHKSMAPRMPSRQTSGWLGVAAIWAAVALFV